MNNLFPPIRYAQCWEDADILLAALDIQPGDTCLSIVSGGENTLSMLVRQPGRVIAIDSNPSQLAGLELKMAAFRELDHGGLLELVGSRASARRAELYRRCRPRLSDGARAFWDGRARAIAQGIGAAGRFESYFSIFRRWILPLVHSRKTVARLLRGGSKEERQQFYDEIWDTRRWRLLFRLFFSRPVMERLGRDPACFRFVEGDVAEHIRRRARYAGVELDPSENPYLEWILKGRHETVLPHALRAEHFETIRAHLDRVEPRCMSLQDFLHGADVRSIQRFNLSDIFEYLPPDEYGRLLARMAEVGALGARLAYWNMLVPRSRPDELQDRLRPLSELAGRLLKRDHAFFYSNLVIEKVCA